MIEESVPLIVSCVVDKHIVKISSLIILTPVYY